MLELCLLNLVTFHANWTFNRCVEIPPDVVQKLIDAGLGKADLSRIEVDATAVMERMKVSSRRCNDPSERV